MMEFHISRAVRNRYHFADTLFSFTGNVVFANVAASRQLAHRMNLVRDVQKHPERAVNAGALYAMGLIDEASHAVMARYREKFDPNCMLDALSFFSEQIGPLELDKMLLTFVEQFPGNSVYRGEQSAREWLAGTTDSVPHRAAAIEEMMLLWMANRNEAFRPFEELFRDADLAAKTAYRRVTQQLPAYFATRPLIPVPGAAPVNLFDLLRAPAVNAPASLSEQLSVIRAKWKTLLGDSLDRLMMIAGEILREEDLAIWARFNPPNAESEAAARAAAAKAAEEAARRRREQGTQQWPGTSSHSDVPVFGDPANEYEKFSADVAWMPTAVLIAKSTYVWLAQLSRKYSRAIDRLDQIPDEDLDDLARRGLNSLWLIGIWERSRASKTIKQLCGNQDAVASAYSLYDYRIADDLGGEAAYITLRDRCFHRGIRLASDMVPNHMGIDSPWVVEHPDWFISRTDTPYPAYNFDGPDLSPDPRVEIKIEKHYYEQTDAAVVFQRRDRQSGETRYIYHGNDGTSFPWNDTAQLDYLNPAVREQVIQTILHVARLFPVIRFDAAMTLAKKHFQRLWFPNPGSSGAIPSRAEYGMSVEQFNKIMPEEFWREVVDRVAAEVPGTLLLAEAFWLMEGYFVRTLGMHRVYNSAFMNMMRDEENAKYRSVIKNTLEFDPDIMKRYVNFMSNPDERTAIDQFGTGDKYFGVTTLMSTLPGLPMFGHGQIEGYTEKYGMEYRWPRYQENPDHSLVERHERQIAPLLHHRALFAESANFLLYDFYREDGSVDENVFAYSNRLGDQRALVLYNNRYSTTRGTIDNSAAYADKRSGHLRQRRLKEGLDLHGDPAFVLAYRDSLTGLEYLRRAVNVAEHGFTIELHAYQCHVLLNWRELRSTAEKPWDRLCDHLAGRGVPSLDDALIGLELQPAHEALRRLLEPAFVRNLADLTEHAPLTFDKQALEKLPPEKQKAIDLAVEEFLDSAWRHTREFLRESQTFYRSHNGDSHPLEIINPTSMEQSFRQRAKAAMRISALETFFPQPWPAAARRVLPSHSPQKVATALWGPVLAWSALELLAASIDSEQPERAALDLFDRLRLREPFGQAFAALGFEGEESWRVAARIKVALLVEADVFAPVPVPESSVPMPEAPASVAEVPEPPEPTSKPKLAASAPATAAKLPQLPILSPSLWQDPDVRWLTGAHEDKGITYFVKESYEELLWWLQLPPLCKLAAQPAPSRSTIADINESVAQAVAAANSVNYQLDKLLDLNADRRRRTAVSPHLQ
ncbi:MAG TPA: alpha-amylase family glycosyl hydrolase [Candidatus Saccharimonadales bacterium]|nr:alpha-amylase family glycosyl hydrolase [Candidatus Saccharimonadales bacterium]